MSEKIITAVTDFLAGKKKFKKGTDDYEILRYGTALIYYDATKTIAFLLASWILGILTYTLAFMGAFGILRRFARGIHLKNNILCTVVGFASYLAGIYLSLHLTIHLIPAALIYAVCGLLHLRYAPSPTENSPIKPDKVLPLKIRAMAVLAVLFVIMLVIGDNAYRNIILTATVIETLYILPITYKLFNEKRGRLNV